MQCLSCSGRQQLAVAAGCGACGRCGAVKAAAGPWRRQHQLHTPQVSRLAVGISGIRHTLPHDGCEATPACQWCLWHVDFLLSSEAIGRKTLMHDLISVSEHTVPWSCSPPRKRAYSPPRRRPSPSPPRRRRRTPSPPRRRPKSHDRSSRRSRSPRGRGRSSDRRRGSREPK